MVIASRGEALLRELEAELNSCGGSILVAPTDLTDDESLKRLVCETMRAFGRIDVLINNAGSAVGGALDKTDPDALHRVLQVNLHGTFRLTQLVLPIMREQKSGHIVNLSSGAGNRSGDPAPETLAAPEGYTMLRTDRRGWISFATDGERL